MPIQPTYTGPYKVISRNNETHTFNVDVNGRTRTVSIGRLKPAFILQQDPDGAKDDAPESITPPSPITVHNTEKPTGILKPSQLPAANQPPSYSNLSPQAQARKVCP